MNTGGLAEAKKSSEGGEFYERRKSSASIDFRDRRTKERRNQILEISKERRRLSSQVRHSDRVEFGISVSLIAEKQEFLSLTHDVSETGLSIYSDVEMLIGTPLALTFCFGEGVCYLNISGQVIFCHSVEAGSLRYAIGMKFSGIRVFEKKILASTIQEYKQGTMTPEKCRLNIVVSVDVAKDFSEYCKGTSQDARASIRQPSKADSFSTVLSSYGVHTQEISGLNLELTAEQKALQEAVRKFTQKEIMPVAANYDRTGEFPWDVLRSAFDLGIFTSYIPEKYGGSGLGTIETALITEELAAGCMAMGTSIMVNLLGVSPILIAGTDEQKESLLVPYCRHLTLFSFCFTEPDAGSDPSRIATRADLVNDSYVLNGSKCFITNGGVADYYIVFATLNQNLGTKGLTAFLTPSNAKGIKRGKALDKMGQRASNTAEIFFEDVKIPKQNRIGAEGEGYKIALLSISRSRINVAAGAVGIARSAMEHALKYVQKRVQFDQPLGNFQYVRFRLADMARDIDAARLLTWRAAWVHDQGRRYAMESSMAKDFAADIAMKVTSEALDLLGGYGYSKEYPMEKLMRDAKLMQIYEGPSPIHKTIIYRELLSKYDLSSK